MNCLSCNTEINNPKFCSRSCAASFNNKIPKRKLAHTCSDCLKIIHRGTKRCRECAGKFQNRLWRNKELGELKKGNAKNYGYPMIRNDSRNTYIKSGKAMSCVVCEYDLHVDICHIKDIKSYALDTPIYIINDINNLIALCKNHHWEFDSGYLSASDLGLPSIVGKDRKNIQLQ